jgi:hypothetical protein
MNKDHVVPEVLNNEMETKLRRIATKGGIALSFSCSITQHILIVKRERYMEQVHSNCDSFGCVLFSGTIVQCNQ